MRKDGVTLVSKAKVERDLGPSMVKAVELVVGWAKVISSGR